MIAPQACLRVEASRYYAGRHVPSTRLFESIDTDWGKNRNSSEISRRETFVKGQDKTARLFIVLGDMDAHRLEGQLKAADGRVVRRVNRVTLTEPGR
jgi:hypothetical protein